MKTKKYNKRGNIGMSILLGIIVIIVILGLTVGTTYYDLWYKKTFKPKYEDVEREVWEHTTSRIQGATQQIAKSKLEYTRSDSDVEKKAICSSLRNMYPNLNPEYIEDYELKTFFKKCKYGE